MCQHLHCLPGPGGLLDQDSFFVEVMDMVVDAQGVKQELDRKKQELASRQQR